MSDTDTASRRGDARTGAVGIGFGDSTRHRGLPWPALARAAQEVQGDRGRDAHVLDGGRLPGVPEGRLSVVAAFGVPGEHIMDAIEVIS